MSVDYYKINAEVMELWDDTKNLIECLDAIRGNKYVRRHICDLLKYIGDDVSHIKYTLRELNLLARLNKVAGVSDIRTFLWREQIVPDIRSGSQRYHDDQDLKYTPDTSWEDEELCEYLLKTVGPCIIIYRDYDDEDHIVLREDQIIYGISTKHICRTYPLDGTEYVIDHCMNDDSCRSTSVVVTKVADLQIIK